MSVSGQEDEFRRLFADEAAARLDRLSQHAMALEASGADRVALDEMFRDAHTLKGGAAVVGLEAVAQDVHALESLLDALRSGRRPLSQEVIDELLRRVDGVRAGIHPPAATLPATVPAAAPATIPERREVPRDAIAVPLERLDELVRLVGESTAAQLRLGQLVEADPVAVEEHRRLSRVLGELQTRTLRARMVTLSTISAPLQRAARDIARDRGREVRWELAGGDTELDRHVLEALRDPLVALVRNAVDHGIEDAPERAARGKPRAGTIRVHAMQLGGDVVISVADDGRGLDLERVRAATGRMHASDAELLEALFEPGVTTAQQLTEISGRGVGLDAVRAVTERLRGRVEVHTEPGAGTEFRITVPMTLAILRCLIVRSGEARYAIPLRSAGLVLATPPEELAEAEGRPAVWVGPDAVSVADLCVLLGRPGSPGRHAVVVATPRGRFALRVDELVDQRDVVVQDLGGVLPRLPLVAGASVEPDGSLMLVLDPDGLVAAARAEAPIRPAPTLRPGGAGRVLVVDDAMVVRELQRSILERAGIEVHTAADGEDALACLAREHFDLVLTDVEMPRLDGISLTRAIRADPHLRGLRVIVLSGRAAEADRRVALEAGADAHMVKSAFDEHALLGSVRRMLGERDTKQA